MVEHEKNKNWKQYEANRKKKLRSIVMSDEESNRLTNLAELRHASRSETVNQLVDEEARRVNLADRKPRKLIKLPGQ